MDMIVNSAFHSMVGAPAVGFVPCDEGCGRESTHAVGLADHRLVCDPCLDHGDRRRLWNLEPRQRL